MSNKTHENNDETIESAQRPKQKIIIVLLLLLAAAVLFLATVAFTFLDDKRLVINGQKIDVTTVDTAAEREKGLSGWERLGESQGMLFVYTDQGQYCMWMKDMKFAIDIIWLDSSKKVVSTKANATPESYPEAFCPSGDAQYVLEAPSGTVSKLGIKPGDHAKF